MRHFPQRGSVVSERETDERIFLKMSIRDASLEKKVPLTFGSYPDTDPEHIQSRTGSVLTEISSLRSLVNDEMKPRSFIDGD